MALEAQVRADLVTAQKAGERFRVGTLRLLVAALGNRTIEKRSAGKSDALTEEEVQEVFQREAKKRREAAEVYTKGARPELAKKESDELALILNYLPAQLSREEIVAKVKELAAGGGDFKTVMPKVMAAVKGKADGKLVAEVVKEVLG